MFGNHRKQRNWGARLHETEIKGMRAVTIENKTLRIGVLVGKGSDVIEFNYKPRDMDFVWLTAGGMRNPTSYLSTSPDPIATYIDYYLGGWQEILPNGGRPSEALGAAFGQHGEVSNLPWDSSIMEDTADAVAVRFSVRTQKSPLYLEKELRLDAAAPRLLIYETLTNESDVSFPVMWGQHLAFGPPFLAEGCRIHLPDNVTIIPHPLAIEPSGRRVKAGRTYMWPYADDDAGKPVDLRILPARGEHSEMLYLTGFSQGWYEIENSAIGLTLRVSWDAEQMPYLWFWQEFGATRSYPWYGRHYNIGLEPFTSYPTNGLSEAIQNGTATMVEPHESRRFSWEVRVIER